MSGSQDLAIAWRRGRVGERVGINRERKGRVSERNEDEMIEVEDIVGVEKRKIKGEKSNEDKNTHEYQQRWGKKRE